MDSYNKPLEKITNATIPTETPVPKDKPETNLPVDGWTPMAVRETTSLLPTTTESSTTPLIDSLISTAAGATTAKDKKGLQGGVTSKEQTGGMFKKPFPRKRHLASTREGSKFSTVSTVKTTQSGDNLEKGTVSTAASDAAKKLRMKPKPETSVDAGPQRYWITSGWHREEPTGNNMKMNWDTINLTDTQRNKLTGKQQQDEPTKENTTAETLQQTPQHGSIPAPWSFQEQPNFERMCISPMERPQGTPQDGSTATPHPLEQQPNLDRMNISPLEQRQLIRSQQELKAFLELTERSFKRHDENESMESRFRRQEEMQGFWKFLEKRARPPTRSTMMPPEWRVPAKPDPLRKRTPRKIFTLGRKRALYVNGGWIPEPIWSYYEVNEMTFWRDYTFNVRASEGRSCSIALHGRLGNCLQNDLDHQDAFRLKYEDNDWTALAAALEQISGTFNTYDHTHLRNLIKAGISPISAVSQMLQTIENNLNKHHQETLTKWQSEVVYMAMVKTKACGKIAPSLVIHVVERETCHFGVEHAITVDPAFCKKMGSFKARIYRTDPRSAKSHSKTGPVVYGALSEWEL